MKTLFLFISCLFFAGCVKTEPQSEIKELRGEVFGSYYLIKYRGNFSSEKFQNELNIFFEEFNREFSTYRSDSIISTFNQASRNKRLSVSPRFIKMLNLAKKFHLETEGAFDPTIAPVVKAWGFGGGKKRESDKMIKEAFTKVGFHHVQWDEKKNEVWKKLDGVELDVNAFAPGWAGDLIGELLQKKDITHFMVDISGEILFKGMKAHNQHWIGGIEKPSESSTGGVQMAFKMNDSALATSGNYRQFFDEHGNRKSHIIDPRTGEPVTHLVSSASVIAESAAAADAWGTAMMVLGRRGMALAEKHGKKALLLEASRSNQFEAVMSDSMKLFLADHSL